MPFKAVSAPTAPVAPPTLGPQPAREAASIWMDGVIKPLFQNLMGGVGVFVLAFLLGMALWPDNMLRVGKLALITGLALFGTACAIRAFRDEIELIVAAYAAGAIDANVLALKAENGRLIAEIERLKSEGMVAHAWGAREAAERLVSDYYQALTSNLIDMHGFLARAESMQRGMTRAQWEQGVRFLQNAGALDRGIMLLPAEDAALVAIARHAATSKVSVRAANGDMAQL